MTRFLKIENILLLFSSVLIVTIAVLNPGAANDNHFEVSELILRFGTLPKSDQCWQCYHPPLYHWLVAQIWSIFGIEAINLKQISAQLLNSGFGICTLYLIKRFIYDSKYDQIVKNWAFVFIAFNPRLIAISAQASNDAMIIFLGTINIYFLIRLSKLVNFKNSIGLLVSIVLASMTKLNFGVLFIADLIVLFYLANKTKNWNLSLKKGYLGTLFLIISLCTLTLLFFNGYFKNLKSEGKVLTYNTPVSGLPPLYKKPNDWFPGVQTIAHGFFTIYYFDLIRNPKLSNDPTIHLKHQTSHFSQLYGRFNYLFFDDWPIEWRTRNTLINVIGKVILALGLLPLIVFMGGIVLLTKETIGVIIGKNKNHESWIALLTIIGFFSFSIIFSLLGKNYTFMKVIYIMPGYIAFVVAYLAGIRYLKDKPLFKPVFGTITYLLAILNIVSVFHLISILIK